MLKSIAVFFPMLLSISLAILARRNHSIACASQKNNILLFFFVVVPVIVYGFIYIGFRPLNSGFDTAAYLRAYSNIGDLMSAHARGAQWYGNTELLWWPIQSIISIFLDARAWLVFNYLLTCLFIYASYRALSTRYNISPMIFSLVLFTFYFVYMGNGIRQALALPIAFLATILFFEKKYYLSLFFISISIGLHWSSIVFLLMPIFNTFIFRRDWAYLLAPCIAISCSVFFGGVASWLVDFFGIEAFNIKYDLYFSSARESHIGAVWETLNFWVCVTSSMFFLWLCKPSHYDTKVIHNYVTLFICLIFFGIYVPDFSERYMPAIFLSLPIVAILIIEKTKTPAAFRNCILLLSFLLMAIAIFHTKSAQFTLGYSL